MTDAAPPEGPTGAQPTGPAPSFAERVADHRSSRTPEPAPIDGPDDRPEGRNEAAPTAELATIGLTAAATFGVTSLIALLAIALSPTLLFGWAATVIESSSMQPTIERGDIVVLRSIDDRLAGIGSVVRFPADDRGSSIVHRIVEVDVDAGAYVTKGDANRNDDRALVPFDQIDGLGTILVPLIGHPALWFHEGRFLVLTLVVVLGIGVIWGGLGAGGGRPTHGDHVDRPGPSSILATPGLHRWSVDGPADIHLFPHLVTRPAGGHPGRGQPRPT